MAAPAKGSGLDKNNKYDRQLRLWGDHGQSALESARVCLINATATGTEIMKNLILPGIGSFTIVDGHKVQGEDVGSNFFLAADSIGKSRAQVATELLAELNDDVAGDYLEENVDSLLEKNPAFFNSFTTVVATQLPERTLLTLGQLLWENNIPLVVCRSYGFIGYLRLVVREHTVIESHPDNSFEDLRLDRPFTGLVDFCDSLHLDEMNKKDHSHTPWLVLIYKYLQVWKQQHEGKMPSNYREKNAFKELIRQGIRISEKGIPEEEENFDEAIKNVNSSLHTTSIPSEIKSLFDNPACTHLSPESSNFWILVRAIKEFTENEGAGFLPLRGSIPDMTSDSERYIQLQNVYKEQAERDVSSVVQHVQRLLQDCEKEEPIFVSSHTKPADIKESDIKMACRNSAFLRVVHCRSLEEEYSLSSANVEELGRHVMEEEEDGQTETDDVVLYILLRAADRFFREFDHYPGVYDHALETDISKLKSCVGKLLHDWQLSSSGIKDDYIQEMCRYGASELHTVAAFMGGVTAQEVIKLVTRQFEPVNNTYIYNAQRQTSTTIQL